MQLLKLPLEVFRLIIASIVQELGLKRALRARVVSRLFADEIWDAIFTTRVIEDITESHHGSIKVRHRLDLIARYLQHRVSARGATPHSWVTKIRETSRALALHMNCENDVEERDALQRIACACLAAQAQHFVFEHMKKEDSSINPQDSIPSRCLALAAWIGDLKLVKSLHKGSDPKTLFGRPSWAAATQGHREVLQFLIDEGALPYNPNFISGPSFYLGSSALASAAYMGHENTVQLYLTHPHYTSEQPPANGWLEFHRAAYYAAQGNRSNILRLLLEFLKGKETEKEYLATLDWSFVNSCKLAAVEAAETALELGAHVNETDKGPRSCLQLAAASGNAQLVKLLLDAGVEIEASPILRVRSSGRETVMRKHMDALTVAKKRDFPEIVRLIEEKKKAIAAKA
ncbi:ankyrin [Lentithecium fluviatile CBS 122367]|uniref:Ankyrin n=1 Tax=Lentithecium fluviatile CBS 122367 TaxID=1168545 RepID=A0A6G1IK47_9PLEO|nr:ankyrin [Lentithecium fluviatile CBS 122367]